MVFGKKKSRSKNRSGLSVDFRGMVMKKPKAELGVSSRVVGKFKVREKVSPIKKEFIERRSKSRISKKATEAEEAKRIEEERWKIVLLSFVKLPFAILFKLLHWIIVFFEKIGREKLLKGAFLMMFFAIILSFANLQVYTGDAEKAAALNFQIIPARRGDIYVNDISQSSKSISVTSSQLYAKISFDPSVLDRLISKGYFTEDEVITELSSSLNLRWGDINDVIAKELARENPRQYAVIEDYATNEQREKVDNLRKSEADSITKFQYYNWLRFEDVSLRTYPNEEFLAATLGYVPSWPVPRDEVLNRYYGCEDMVYQNEKRDTFDSFTGRIEQSIYTVGVYGIEQKFCSVLGGLNGRQILTSEVGTEKEVDTKVVNGADIYLTIDRNIQKKAEEILDRAVKANTNNLGAPKDGTIVVLDADDGAVLAMASYPKVDPNEYYKNIKGFRNAATSVDYEVGSVMKPLTVAMAMNERKAGNTDADGDPVGVASDWKFEDYNNNGKPYQERNGNIRYIKNAEGKSYSYLGKIGINDCLKYSINTCLAEIQESVGNSKTKEYFEEKYMMGKDTLVDLPGDVHGYTQPFENDIMVDFSYGSFAFGQGFRSSPLQLVRAYTALANDGKLIEPYLVDKIVYDGGRVDDGTREDSLDAIKKKQPVQILDKRVVDLVTGYLVETVDEGYKRVSRGRVPGYSVAAKTGTAEVSRMDNYKDGKCKRSESVQACNTRLGIYDHTYIGYGPETDPEVIVLIKLSEPNPGVIQNYSVNTLGQHFSDMMRYTLEYMGVPKDR